MQSLNRTNRRSLIKKIILKANHIDNFSYIDEIYNWRVGALNKRWVLMLPGLGCQWAKEHKGGCYMCGFKYQLDRINSNIGISIENRIKFAYLLGSYLSNIEQQKPALLAIYNGGSYLNCNEIPRNIQLMLLKSISKRYPTIKNILVESRPEFINAKNLMEIQNVLKDNCLLSIGIGLECQSDYIRQNYINKGFTRHDYERAVHFLKKNGFGVLTYVFLKPIILSEKLSIGEAVKTIKYAFDCGTDEVALESAFVQENTVMHKYYKAGNYKPPWLWSILDVVNRGIKYGPIHIGSFHDKPDPIDVPHNCPNCDDRVMKAISYYNKSHDFSFLESIQCDCQKQWKEEIH